MAEPSRLRRFAAALGRAFTAARRFTANVLFLLFLVLVVVLLFSGPRPVTVPDGAALVLAPEGAIVEQREQGPPLGPLLGTGAATSDTELRDIIEALDGARTDPRIALVMLDVDKLTGVSPAHLEAIGSAIDAVKAAGKEVLASGDFYTQSQYYLASHADVVYLHPMGQVLLHGYGAYQSYYRSALEKLKVKMHVFRVGTYKEAVEPFIRDDMSPEARTANQVLVDELWDAYITKVASNRGLTAEDIDAYVEQFPERLAALSGDMARLAVEGGLVDELATRDAVRAQLIAKVGEHDHDFLQIGYRDYLSSIRSPLPIHPGPKVGVIVAAGVIQNGEAPRGTVGADTLTELIRDARLDPDVRAAVLRVDSPGGGAFASELIRQELELFQLSGKPLVVSMAGVAASGGYWISATADEIWAAPTTVTGSIGIFGIVPTFEDTMAALGIARDGVGSTSLAGATDVFSGMSDAMARIVQANVENGYQRFLNLVARGRDMLPDAVDAVGQGRVWTGRQAQAHGLVDNLGGLNDAIAAAATRAGLSEYTVRYIEKPLSTREQLLAQLSESLGLAPIGAIAELTARAVGSVRLLETLNDPADLYMLCDGCALY